MAGKHETNVTVRMPSDLLEAAHAEAKRRDETLSRVLRRALREYVAAAPEATAPKARSASRIREL